MKYGALIPAVHLALMAFTPGIGHGGRREHPMV
jgi:hypothetical protein